MAQKYVSGKIVTRNWAPNSFIRAPIFHVTNCSQRQPKSGPELCKSGADFGLPANFNFALQTPILSHFYNIWPNQILNRSFSIVLTAKIFDVHHEAKNEIFHMYSSVFKKFGVMFPFTSFEGDVLKALNYHIIQ